VIEPRHGRRELSSGLPSRTVHHEPGSNRRLKVRLAVAGTREPPRPRRAGRAGA
jgi:hypothetical protein